MSELPRRIQVVHEGSWYEVGSKQCSATSSAAGGCLRYTVAPGHRYLQRRPQKQLRVTQ